MPKHFYFAYLFPLVLMLTACNEEKPVVKKQEEVYDWHNEKYQDFFSQYMRKQTLTTNDHVNYSFNSKDIEKTLNIKLNTPVQGLLNITRVEPKDNQVSKFKNFNNPQALLDFYKNTPNPTTGEYTVIKLCEEKSKINGLFCIINPQFGQERYYYFPNEKKFSNINQSIRMDCEYLFTPESACRIINLPNSPYNLNIWVYFRDPNYFFYIIPFIENHIYQTTGQHIVKPIL